MGGRGASVSGGRIGYHSGVKAADNKVRGKEVEYATVIDENGNELYTVTSEMRSQVLFNEQQLNQMKNATLTHNHPSSSTFSVEDVDVLVVRQLEAIRAVGEKVTYQLRKTKDSSKQNNFANDYFNAKKENKKITDKKYNKIRYLEKSNYTKYMDECDKLNKELNSLNSKWLKANAKRYGYRYSVVRRK